MTREHYRTLIEAAARRQWSDQTSISYRNRKSVPRNARRGFVVIADFGGVCVLEPSGRFRVFNHRAEELDAEDVHVTMAMRQLGVTHPQIAAALRDAKSTNRSA